MNENFLLLSGLGKTAKSEGRTLADQIDAILPQTQCTQCDFEGCKPYSEAIVNGDSDHQSLVGQLNKLESLPLPHSDNSYNWLMVLNRSQGELLKSLYIQTSDDNKLRIDSLENRIHKILKKSEDLKITTNSF